MNNTKKKHSVNKLTKQQAQSLKTFAASFYFLSQEAEREGFNDLNIYIREGIARIDATIQEQELASPKELLDESLYQAMQFLYKLNVLSPNARTEFVHFFGALREICEMKPKKARAAKLLVMSKQSNH